LCLYFRSDAPVLGSSWSNNCHHRSAAAADEGVVGNTAPREGSIETGGQFACLNGVL